MDPDGSSKERNTLKKRKLLDMTVYSYLLSNRGVFIHDMKKKIEDVCCIEIDFHAAGVRDLKQVLDEHKNIEQQRDGSYHAIPVAETLDLNNLIAKQKKKGGKSGKKRRPASSNSFRPLFSFSKSPKYRPATGFSYRPTTASRMTGLQPVSTRSSDLQSSSSTETVKKVRPAQKSLRPESAAPYMFPTSSTPLPKKSKAASSKVTTTNVLGGISSQANMTVVAASAKKECRFPSVKEFHDNVKLLFIKQYPHSININELGREYGLEYGHEITPEALFSKTWTMFVKSVFADFLDFDSQQNVKLRDSWARANSSAMGRNINSASSSIPSIETPTSDMCNQMQGLKINNHLPQRTVPARNTAASLPFEDRPPGMESPSEGNGRTVRTVTVDHNSLKIHARSLDRSDYDDTGTIPASQKTQCSEIVKSVQCVQKPLLPTVAKRTRSSAEPTARLATSAFKEIVKQERALPVARRIVESSPTKNIASSSLADPFDRDRESSSVACSSRCASRSTKVQLPPEARPSSAMYFVSPKKTDVEKRVPRRERTTGSLKSTVTLDSKNTVVETPRARRLEIPPQTFAETSRRSSPYISSNNLSNYIELSQNCPLDDNESF